MKVKVLKCMAQRRQRCGVTATTFFAWFEHTIKSSDSHKNHIRGQWRVKVSNTQYNLHWGKKFTLPMFAFLCHSSSFFSSSSLSYSCLHFCFPVRIPALSSLLCRLYSLTHSNTPCDAVQKWKHFLPLQTFRPPGERWNLRILSVSNKEKYLHRVLKHKIKICHLAVGQVDDCDILCYNANVRATSCGHGFCFNLCQIANRNNLDISIMQWNIMESKTFSSIIHPNDDIDARYNTHDNLLRITKLPLKTLPMRLIDFSLIIERCSERWKVHHTQAMIRVGIFDSTCPKLKSRQWNEFRRIDIFSISLWRKTSFRRKFRHSENRYRMRDGTQWRRFSSVDSERENEIRVEKKV